MLKNCICILPACMSVLCVPGAMGLGVASSAIGAKGGGKPLQRC